ncbi:MAG: glycoside hydrolase family 2, partial [Tannerella sp.]|nr:glycoside hydrolase family 2 [Tannerella sp.]
TTWLENYGTWGYAGEFLQYGGQSDEVAGEFWTGILSEIGEPEIRCATSAAHTYGKSKVWAEAFTSADGNYQRHPASIKQLGDWAFAEGINAYILHVNIQQQSDGKFPGNDAWYSIEFNRKNTWFSQADLFTTYARRCGFMLQQGLDVADVAYYIGEDAPKMGGVTNPPIPKGYHYDHINAEALLRDATVKDGKLTLPHGTSYRALVLPPQETMRPEVLQKIMQLVNDGATVIGNPPERSPSLENYPAADKQVQELAAALWGETPEKQHAYGKGKIFTNTSPEEIFQMLNLLPDFQADEKAPVFYTHRKTADADIYFITNQSDKRIQLTPQFRVSGKQPELWEPVTAERWLLPAFVQNDATTAVPLQLEPSGSVFVVFRKPGKPKVTTQGVAALQVNFPEPEVVSEVKSPWTVTFESDAVKRGPAQPVTFTELTDWSKNDNEQIRYFSGAAVYKTTVEGSTIQKVKNSTIWLDLGKVGVMAKVKVNGEYAGGVWTYPYRVEITPFVKAGQNEIEVETVNTWANRIIGDKMLPEAERKLHLSGIANRASVIQESGLLGPVKIIAVK